MAGQKDSMLARRSVAAAVVVVEAGRARMLLMWMREVKRRGGRGREGK